MSKLSHLLLRAIAAFGLALPLIAVAGSPAAAAPTATHFFADHSRNCDYAFTEGRIEWNPIHVGQVARVDVTGVLADVPVPCAPPTPGIGDPFAEFTAYVDGQQVDAETVHPSWDGPAPVFRFSLANAGSARLIDQVDVRVCRTFGPMLPAFTCGDTQTYHRSEIGPAG